MSTIERVTPLQPADGVSHLLVADDALAVDWGSHVAVCGAEVVEASGTAGTDDPGYCPECVRAAVSWNARGGGPVSGQSSGDELLEWLVLRRVADGGVVKVGTTYLDGGRRTSGHLAGPLEELIAAGLLGPADPDPAMEATARVGLSAIGRTRYAQLRQRPWAVSPPEYATRTTATPAPARASRGARCSGCPAG
ncbi:MAG: hypothetical protein ABR608_04610 [Pseudonocardiaceae bacterium]